MKCKYTFPAVANVTIPIGLSFETEGFEYKIELKDGQISGISVTVSDFPKECLPTITPLVNQVATAEFKIPEDPFREIIISKMRAIEGGLCLWGLKEISIDEVNVEWIPESEDEKRTLQLFSFEMSWKPQKDTRAIPPDMLLRTIMVNEQLRAWELPLNFYRRGRIDISEGRYIEAIYDLYFVLETMYANGKFKSKQVTEEFLAADELTAAISTLKTDPNRQQQCPPRLITEYAENFLDKTCSEIIKGLVEVRGFLHHHTQRRADMWHPAKQREYHVESLIFLNICTRVLMDKVTPLLFEEETFKAFRDITVTTDQGELVDWQYDWTFEEWSDGSLEAGA